MKALFNALLFFLAIQSLTSCQSGGGGSANQPCSEMSVGSSCGGGIFAGNFDDYSLITTPGNCSDSSTPTCDGSADTLKKQWATNAAAVSGATDADNGKSNTTTIVNAYALLPGNDSPAASFCNTLDYGGYTDWYLPSTHELNTLFTNRNSIDGFNQSASEYYWTSTEMDSSSAYRATFDNGTATSTSKNANLLIRCVRQDD